MVTRADILTHIHQPLQHHSSNPPPSSSTTSVYRIHWRELTEWQTFHADTMAYWNALDDNDKNAILPVPPGYWSVIDLQLPRIVRRINSESSLGPPFLTLYAGPHNEAVSGARDEHGFLEMDLPQNVVGRPDGCFDWNDRIAGIVEIKTFWNVTQEGIDQVFQGID